MDHVDGAGDRASCVRMVPPQAFPTVAHYRVVEEE
jgi:hypothetical protein